MGAPKQKWTSEEEAALKAGVAKYGAGKWSTILKDPEFSNVLHSRSNVDLKDKWRNVNVAANGWGSRHRARVSLKNNRQTSKQDELALSTVDENEIEIVDAKPLAVFCETSENACPKIPIPRLDNLILEAITKLKEPRGSSRATIAAYIEERYVAPPNFEKLLAATLKLLAENGKLIKVKHQYRIAPPSMLSDAKKDSFPLLTGGKQKKDSMLPDAKKDASPLLLGGKQKKDSTPFVAKKDPFPLLLGEKQKNAPKVEKNEFKILTKSQIDAELEKMKSMTAQEAAAAAAQAVAEAEAAIAEAEEAAREAEKAEAEAEAAQVFAEAAMKALKRRTVCA